MKKKNTWLALSEQAILEEGRPLTTTQIAKIIEERYKKETKSSNPSSTIASRLLVSVRNDPNTVFKRVEDENGYVAYQLKEMDEQADIISAEKFSVTENRKNERNDLHPLLVHHQFNNNNETYLKTIRHQASTKSNRLRNKWVFPDMVGVNLAGPWNKTVHELGNLYSNLNAFMKISSYEVKWELTEKCYRESFFQCVSNSSWAMESWLAAYHVSPDPLFHQELKRLNNQFGVGFIQLSTDVGNSQVIYPATTRKQLQYETIDDLYKRNLDFREFIETIINMSRIQEPLKEKFDVILDDDELEEHINKFIKKKISRYV